MNMNVEYVAKMEAQLKQWDADVVALVAEADKANARARAAYDERLKDLRESRDAAAKTLREIGAASEVATDQMRSSMEGAWVTMQRTLARVSSDFRTRPSTRSA